MIQEVKEMKDDDRNDRTRFKRAEKHKFKSSEEEQFNGATVACYFYWVNRT